MKTLQNPFRITFRAGDDAPAITLRAGDHFRLYPVGVRGNADERLSTRMVDLLRLSQGIVVVDGLLQRKMASAGFRSPRLEIEVFDAEFWDTEEVASTLKSCVDFLSGDDDWQFQFIPDRKVRHHFQRSFTFAEPTTVCPYSGGLDWAAGLATRMREQPDCTYIPVVVRHQFPRGRQVKRQFDLLKQGNGVDGSRFLPLVVASFIRNTRLQHEFGLRTRETSHRCRSFLFCAVAGAVAASEGCNSVEIFESGIGAVNLPLSGDILGWRTTRSTHPHFLRTMSKLVSLVAGRELNFELPFVNRTKAELVTGLARNGQGELALSSVSCILHPLRRGNNTQCGWCPACIYRRYALKVADIQEPKQAYHYDLFGSLSEFERVPEKKLGPLLAFLRQVNKLSELDGEGTVPSFFRNHLVRTKVVEGEGQLIPFVKLFRRYRREWIDLVSRERTRDLVWGDWLTPRKVAM
jgi:7-cyano-7-deazaguanine synthase in queuosine biosynthesis